MENHSNIKVSILVPVYGVEKYIGQCARTLFEQDYQNIEYVFVNDCTKDGSIEVLQETLKAYPHRASQVRIINHEVNKGLAAARNTALENSCGEYILPVDSDDFLNGSNAVSLLVQKAVEEEDDAVFYDMEYYPHDINCPKFDIPLNYKKLTNIIIVRGTYLSIWGGLYRKSLFIDHNIRSLENISMGEDYAIKPRLTYYMKKIGHIQQPFYVYRQENNTSITKRFKSSHIDDLRICIDGFYDFFKDKPDYSEYEESIKVAEIRCKVQCLQWWCYFEGTNADFEKINRVFPFVPFAWKYLRLSEYVLYLLAGYNMKKILKMLLNFKQKK